MSFFGLESEHVFSAFLESSGRSLVCGDPKSIKRRFININLYIGNGGKALNSRFYN